MVSRSICSSPQVISLLTPQARAPAADKKAEDVWQIDADEGVSEKDTGSASTPALVGSTEAKKRFVQLFLGVHAMLFHHIG